MYQKFRYTVWWVSVLGKSMMGTWCELLTLYRDGVRRKQELYISGISTRGKHYKDTTLPITQPSTQC